MYFTVLWQTKLKQDAKANLGVHFCDVLQGVEATTFLKVSDTIY